MRYQLQAYAIQEYGKRIDEHGNPHQEDSMFPACNSVRSTDRLFILCDGMGGHEAGEVASQAVCDAMANVLLPGHDPEGPFTADEFRQALSAAFDALDAKDSGSDRKMGTTMTLLKLHSAGAFIAHIGDSRVYHIRPGVDGNSTQILHETSDHSLVNDLVRIGEMTREEAHRSSRKNIITRAMQPGLDPRPKADIYETADIRPGDYFYLCSDGMLEEDAMESGERLRQIFSQQGGDDPTKVRELTAATVDNSDNHTAFIVHITDVIDPVAAPVAQSNAVANPVPEVPQVPIAPAAPEVPAGHPGVQSAAPAPVPRKGNTKMLVIVIAAIVVLLLALIAVIGMVFWHANSEPETQPAPVENQQTPAEQVDEPAPFDSNQKNNEANKELENEAEAGEPDSPEPMAEPQITPEPPATGNGAELPEVPAVDKDL